MAIFEGKNGEWKTTKNGVHFFVPDDLTDEEALEQWYEADLVDTGFGYKHKGIEYATDSEIDEKENEEFNKSVDKDVQNLLLKMKLPEEFKEDGEYAFIIQWKEYYDEYEQLRGAPEYETFNKNEKIKAKDILEALDKLESKYKDKEIEIKSYNLPNQKNKQLRREEETKYTIPKSISSFKSYLKSKIKR